MGRKFWATYQTLGIVFNDNSYGLTRDARILRNKLSDIGWQVSLLAPKDRTKSERIFRTKAFDIVIHLETVHRYWLGAGRVQLIIPNPEWFEMSQFRHIRRFDQILVKTADAERRFKAIDARTVFLGFTSEDRSDPSTGKNWDRFFHLAGGSCMKGTQDILNLWAAHPHWPELVLVQRADAAPAQVPPNVILHNRHLPDDELRNLQNDCGMHLCPSRAEGWGHYIAEAMSCGALILTTDAPPMNELLTPDTGILAEFDRTEIHEFGKMYFVRNSDLKNQIERMIAMSAAEKEQMGQAARRRFLDLDRRFTEEIGTLFRRSERTVGVSGLSYIK